MSDRDRASDRDPASASEHVTPTEIDAMAQAQAALVELRRELLVVKSAAPTPAVAEALRLADIYLFMALSYTGHDDQLFPEEGQFTPGGELT